MNYSLISRMRMAVSKVKFLLNFDVNRWRVASVIAHHRRRSSLPERWLSFNDRPGLRACTEDADDSDHDHDRQDHQDEDDDEVSSSRSSNSSGRGLSLQRTISYPSDQDYDIDQRAEMFISNFRRQLRMERQISLELQYCRANSFQGIKSP